MDRTTEILIILLIWVIIAVSGWWILEQYTSEKETKITEIVIDGEIKQISPFTLPITLQKAWEIIEKFCKSKTPPWEYNYEQMEKINDEWRIPILNINCICGAVVDAKTGETECVADFLSERDLVILEGTIKKEDYTSTIVWSIETKDNDIYVLIGEKSEELIKKLLISTDGKKKIKVVGYLTETAISREWKSNGIQEALDIRKAIEIINYSIEKEQP